MDNIEQYISDNREAMDADFPGLDLWGRIDRELGKPPKSNRVKKRLYWRGAAAVLVAALAAVWCFSGSEASKESLVNVSPVGVERQHPELAEMAEYYNHKINQCKGRLAAMNHHDPEIYRDLRQLERTFDTLQWEWQQNPHKSDERLVGAMVANYQNRYMLLENVVRHLNNKGTPAYPNEPVRARVVRN